MNALRKYWALFKISFKDRMFSSSEVLVRTVFFAAVIYIFSQLWGALSVQQLSGASQGASAAGASGASASSGTHAGDLVWYLFVTESIILSLPPLPEQVDQEIQTGSIAYQLVRPLSYVGSRAMAYLGDVCARFWINAFVGFATAFWMVGSPPHGGTLVGSIAVMLALILGAFLIHLSLSLCISMLGFWVEDTLPFFWIYSKAAFILGGLFMPIDYYPKWLRGFCGWLPFKDGVYTVAETLIHGSASVWILLGRQLGWATAGITLSVCLYHVGIERLEARGG
jgi:ABC-2 type transport system permease protein